MLIYVNQFTLVDIQNEEVIFRTIAGWLKQVTKKHFTVDELRSSSNYPIDKARVRTFSALDYEPELYSVLLSHPDRENPGRQWITEIGIKKEKGRYTLSLLLEVSDVSTQVRRIPSTTRPGLIRFLIQNAKLSSDTVGLRVKKFQNSINDFKSLSYEIERPDRNYPIVLVSNRPDDGKAYVNPNKLQEQLVGLAQVVYSHEEINSWDMEDCLTRRYSAWDGAINIIFPSFGRGFSRTRLLLSDMLETMREEDINITHEILSIITHTTNGFKKRHHFSPTDVRAKRQKDLRMRLKSEFDEMAADGEFQSLADQAFQQLDEQDELFEKEREENRKTLDSLETQVIEQDDEISDLKSQLRVLQMRCDDFTKTKPTVGASLLVSGDELDKYEGEIRDVIIDSLSKQLEAAKEFSRRFDILTDVVMHNQPDGKLADFITELDLIFQNYDGITPKIQSSLKAMGLEIEEDKNHNKLKFVDDSRYKMTFSKSPSDKRRVGKNIVQQARQELF